MDDNGENGIQQRIVDHSQQGLLQEESFHWSDYEQASQQEIMVQFARNSYPLVGALIDGNLIKGDFGYGEIQQPKNQRLIKLQNNQLTIVEQVSKIIITKSTLTNTKKKDLLQNQTAIKQKNNQQSDQHHNLIVEGRSIFIQNHQLQPIIDNDHNQQAVEVQDEQRFFSESSKSSDEEDREQREHAVNRIKKKSLIRKSSNGGKDTTKLSKNILKKKLKYLSTKK